MTKYKVIVADNFHYMDESEHYPAGEFETYEEAVVVAKQIVEASLDDALGVERSPPQPLTPALLFQNYMMFGDDPFILPDDHTPRFSAWDYARARCEELLRQKQADADEIAPDSK